MKPQLSPEQRQALAEAIYTGRKIEAIKQLRAATGLDLKEAKDIVDHLEADLRAEHPERFASKAEKRGCTSMILLTMTAVGLLAYFLRR